MDDQARAKLCPFCGAAGEVSTPQATPPATEGVFPTAEVREIVNYAMKVAEKAGAQKRLLANDTPEYAYEQGRVDVARIICAIWLQTGLVDRYGEVMYTPGQVFRDADV